jgi:hypothetical protein
MGLQRPGIEEQRLRVERQKKRLARRGMSWRGQVEAGRGRLAEQRQETDETGQGRAG